ncbi:MAG: CBS domain-containing protein [Desulfobacterales bacterium]
MTAIGLSIRRELALDIAFQICVYVRTMVPHAPSDSHKQELTLITTHINADYDALASLLAAQKLYPQAIVVFPGSQEKNLKNFFVKSMVYLFNIVDIKEVDFSKITRLVLVDTKQPNRIGKLASLLKKPGLQIHIYDHHPSKPDDIQGHYERQEPTGANVTILIEIIKAKEIELASEEATIMCLGIYEDTGSFTFASTTQKDFQAAAFLVSKGANLNIVSDLIAREISPQQVALLNELIQSAESHNVHGIDVLITRITKDNYIPDFAFLVHKMVKMENIKAIFAIAGMENKIYIVARSRIPEVDVGSILTPLGGGGHSFAAAASLKGQTMAQIEQQLIKILYQEIRSRRQAKDLMSSPPITVAADLTCLEASTLLRRYNINALLVVQKSAGPDSKEKIAGYITRQVIEKALYHKLDQVSVSEYMTTEMTDVPPEADLMEIQDKIIANKQRILPVIDNGTIRGVVTRTDLLNILVSKSYRSLKNDTDPLDGQIHARTRNINRFMQERLPKRIREILKKIGLVAAEIECGVYVVGGFVRDLFLYRPNEDLDIVIEGDGIEFAARFAKIVGGRIHAHAKFGTAVVIFPDGSKIDVASARLEYYRFPADLPVVEMSSIKLDLFRRDFTINTLAIQLNPDKYGTLIDFFTAQKDIKAKAVRILHNLSFVEDPTRVFRAIRFEQRFGFSIGKLTAGLIKNAVKMDFFKRLSGRRVFTELRLILEEENPVPAIVRLQDYDLLRVIHPSISLDDELTALLNATKKVLSWYDLLFLEESYMKWTVYFLALVRQCTPQTTAEICRRLELAPRFSPIFCEARFACDQCLKWLERHLPVKNSVLYHKLSAFKTELILYMMSAAKAEKIKKTISFYFTNLRYTTVGIRGKDLLTLGLKPGPAFRQILDAVLDAKLNGSLRTRRDELEYVKRNFMTAEFK